MAQRWAILGAAVALALLSGCLRDFEEPGNLRILKLDLAADEVHANEVLLNVTSVLDNRDGGRSGHVTLEAKAYDQSTGFLIAENVADVGRVPGEKTRSVSIPLTVPREGSVRIEVVLKEDGKGEQQASIAASNLEGLKPDAYETGLTISEMDFIAREVKAGEVKVQCSLYFTNEGLADSEDLRVLVKAREVQTRLIVDTATLFTRAIGPGETIIRSANLSVPDDYNYFIEILIWRGDVVVGRDQGTVQLSNTTVELAEGNTLVVSNPDTSQLVYSRGSFDSKVTLEEGSRYYGDPYGEDSAAAKKQSQPALGWLGVVAAALAAVVLFRRIPA